MTDEMTRDAAFELVDEAIELVIQCPWCDIHGGSMGVVVCYGETPGILMENHGEDGDIVGTVGIMGISWVRGSRDFFFWM